MVEKNYGSLTGKSYAGLPDELNREDLAKVTAQPLLNYLVALGLARRTGFFKGHKPELGLCGSSRRSS